MENNKVESEANVKKIAAFLDLYEKKDMNKIDKKIFKGIIERNVSEEDAFSDSNENPSQKESFVQGIESGYDLHATNNKLVEPESLESNDDSKQQLTSRLNIENNIANEYAGFKLPPINYPGKNEKIAKKIIMEEEKNCDIVNKEFTINHTDESKAMVNSNFKYDDV